MRQSDKPRWYRSFLPLMALAYLIGLSPHLLTWNISGELPPALEWNLTHYYVNYLEHGALRRGLFGTLLAPLIGLTDPASNIPALLMLAIDAGVCLGLALALRNALLNAFGPAPNLITAAAVIAPVGALQLGYDAGRLDHINLAMMALAMQALNRNRTDLAAVLALVMIAIHEAALFYALPVLAALAWQTHCRRATLIVALPALSLAAFFALFGATPPDLAQSLPESANLAASVWSRDLLEPARGFAPQHYLLAVYLALAPMALLYSHYRANAARPDPLFFAPLASLALFVLGVDYGRWCQLTAIACLMVILNAPGLGRKKPLGPISRPETLVSLPWLLPLGPIGIALFYPFIPFVN